MLGNKYTLEKLLEAEPTLKDKILSFFKGASTDYADVSKLSSAAKKYYRTYKKLFDEFSARNVANNKKNRVTAAQFASDKAIANTPRSPRSDNSIPETEEKSNSFFGCCILLSKRVDLSEIAGDIFVRLCALKFSFFIIFLCLF